MWTRLTFYSQPRRCCVAIVELTPCPYLLLTHFPRSCCVTWVVLFLSRLSVDPDLPGGLDRSSLFTCQTSHRALNPFGVLHELSLISSAAPHYRRPLPHALWMSFTSHIVLRDKQLTSRLLLEYSSHCPCLVSLIPPALTHLQHPHIHAQNWPKLFRFIVTEQNTRSSGALMHCQLLHVLRKLLHLVPQELLHTFITRCSVPGGCLCKSSFP